MQLRNLVPLLLIVLLGGCGLPAPETPAATSEPLPGQAPALVAAPSGGSFDLPGLPELGGTRGASSTDFTPLLQRGNVPYAASTNATPDHTEELLLLGPGESEMAWTIHAFSGFDPQRNPSGIELLTYDAEDQTLHLALANYSLGRWEFFSVELVDEVGDYETIRLPIADPAPYLSPLGNVYFAVVAYGASLEVRYAALQFDIRVNTWVQGLSATSDQPDMITVSWEAVPEATGYVIYYRFLNFPGNLLLLTETVDPQFVHSATEPPGKEVIPQEPYMYFVAALFGDGTCSQLTGYAVGVTAPPPPP